MTPEQLRDAAAVMLAAAEGKEIHFRGHGATKWYSGAVTFNWDYFEYKVAPETVKYRRFLAYSLRGKDPQCFTVGFPCDFVAVRAAWGKDFIRWIDTEWQEVEV